MLHILKTDTPLPPIVAKEGDYGVIFSDKVRAAGYEGDIAEYDSLAGEYPSLEFGPDDAILVTGSKHDSWGDAPWVLELNEWLKKAIGKVPIVGICFGHQIVARALGADVGRAKVGWELGVYEMELTEKGQAVLPQLQKKFPMIQMHKDQVFELPKDTELLAKSPLCPIQGYYRPHELFCVQGHPEFDQFIVDTVVESRFPPEDEVRVNALAHSGDRHDGLLIFKTIVKFINREL